MDGNRTTKIGQPSSKCFKACIRISSSRRENAIILDVSVDVELNFSKTISIATWFGVGTLLVATINGNYGNGGDN